MKNEKKNYLNDYLFNKNKKSFFYSFKKKVCLFAFQILFLCILFDATFSARGQSVEIFVSKWIRGQCVLDYKTDDGSQFLYLIRDLNAL